MTLPNHTSRFRYFRLIKKNIQNVGYDSIPSPSFEGHINIRIVQMSEGHTPKQSLKMHAVDLGKVLCVCAWGESRDSPVRYSVELMSLNDKESTGSPHNLVLQKRIHNDHWNGWAFVDAQQLNPVKSVISLEMLKKERTKSATAGHFQNEINSGGRNGIIIFWVRLHEL